MKLGQILDILEKRYSRETLGGLYSKESYERATDRRKIIRTIWKDVIVPQASKIQHTTTIKPAQKIGLYRYFDFSYNRYDPDEFSVDEIGVENDALLKQFNSMINNYLPCLPHSLYKKYIGHIVIGNLEISRLYRIKDDSIELEKLLQEPYKESLEKLMSQLREVIVDDQTMEKLKKH